MYIAISIDLIARVWLTAVTSSSNLPLLEPLILSYLILAIALRACACIAIAMHACTCTCTCTCARMPCMHHAFSGPSYRVHRCMRWPWLHAVCMHMCRPARNRYRESSRVVPSPAVTSSISCMQCARMHARVGDVDASTELCTMGALRVHARYVHVYTMAAAVARACGSERRAARACTRTRTCL